MDKNYKTTDAPQCSTFRLPDLKTQNETLAQRFCEELERANALDARITKIIEFVTSERDRWQAAATDGMTSGETAARFAAYAQVYEKVLHRIWESETEFPVQIPEWQK